MASDERYVPACEEDAPEIERLEDECQRLREALSQIPEMVRRAVENHCQHPSEDGQERCACDDIMDDFRREYVGLARQTALAEGERDV